MSLNFIEDRDLLKLALKEDLGSLFKDVTSDVVFGDADFESTARIISKHPDSFILSGISLAKELAQTFSVTMQSYFQDGDKVQPGEVVLMLQGSIKNLLMLERTLLNFLQSLSAIATQTKNFVDRVKHTKLKILDTRKTIPGMRYLSKYAVACGGGVNHRIGLYDAILIKDNHIDALGGVRAVLDRLPSTKKYHTVLEIRTLSELEIVLQYGLGKVDRVLLDNMNLAELKICVELCKNKIETEASGNVSLATIVAIAETGVDYVSIGKLTHSISNIDLSMQLQES